MPVTTPPGFKECDGERLEDIPRPAQHDAKENILINELSRNSSKDPGSSSSNSLNFDFRDKDIKLIKKAKTDNKDRSKEYPYVLDKWDEVFPKFNSFGIPLPCASVLSRKLADAVIIHARENNIINECDVSCKDCSLFPVLPVTGPCGHTRCTQCIKTNGACPCGVMPREILHVNTLVQDLVEKLVQKLARPSFNTGFVKRYQIISETDTPPGIAKKMTWRTRSRRECCPYARPLLIPAATHNVPSPVPMSYKTRYDVARELVFSKRYYEAVPLLAHVATSPDQVAKDARSLLDRVIAALLVNGDRQRLTRQLFQLVQQYSMNSWLQPKDLTCSLCCSPFNRPVTTPCGHSYCRTCLEQSLDYWKMCPLCKSPMEDYNIFTSNETEAITAALRSINAIQPPVELASDEIRLLVCTIAYPGVACPLFMVEPRCWVLVRRVLESGGRFGMLCHRDNDGTTSSIGTIMEIRDCVYFENGRSIISTVGVSRFRVLERDTKDGCDVAKYEPFVDLNLDTEAEACLQLENAVEVSTKAMNWIKTLDSNVLRQIENTFGKQPDFQCLDTDLWDKNDGPMWLWWLICILPLQIDIKMMLITSMDLVKRLLAVSCTFDAIKRECEWNANDMSNMMSDVISQEDLEWLNSTPDIGD